MRTRRLEERGIEAQNLRDPGLERGGGIYASELPLQAEREPARLSGLGATSRRSSAKDGRAPWWAAASGRLAWLPHNPDAVGAMGRAQVLNQCLTGFMLQLAASLCVV
ncbi:MAG: hypothetical protein ACK6AD_11580 [Cyanobacteriota bacterium]